MYSERRTVGRPPQTVRLPRAVPLSRESAATPTTAAIWRRPSCPSSGSSAISVRATTFADTWHRAQKVFLHLPQRTSADRLLKLRIESGKLPLEPCDMPGNRPAQGHIFRTAVTILFGDKHLAQLPTPRDQFAQPPCLSILE